MMLWRFWLWRLWLFVLCKLMRTKDGFFRDLGHRRLRQAEVPGGHRLHTKGAQKITDLPHLAHIMGRDDQFAGREAPHQMTAFCAATSSPMPFLASVIISANCASEKGEPSALPCSSTKPPEPVITKFASVPASLSSA